VLVTPLTRRSFVDGKLVNDLAPWAAATRKVAAELKVPLLDLNADSATAVGAMGSAAADRFAEVPPGAAQPIPPTPAPSTEVMVNPMAQPKLSFDHTHLGIEGANYFATMVTRELSVAIPEMRPLLVP
jgi:lysophospholipase L1-like esterase